VAFGGDTGGKERGGERRPGPLGENALAAPRVLVVGTDDWAIEHAAAELEAGGCGVRRCHEPGQPVFPCNALVEGRTCPLDAGVDVVTDARGQAVGNLLQSEFGVVCALHHGIPLVLAGVAPERPLGPWATRIVEHGGSLVDACAEAACAPLGKAPARASSSTGL
jgi:hypothetical protein